MPPRFAVLAGPDFELWQGSIDVAVGGHAGARVRLNRQWSVVAVAGPMWDLGRPGGVGGFTVGGALTVDLEIVPRLRVGLGAVARGLWASLDGSGAPSGTQNRAVGVTAGVMATARYGVPVGPVVVSLGPQLEALVRPIVVEVAGSEIFRLPTWLTGLSLEVATP